MSMETKVIVDIKEENGSVVVSFESASISNTEQIDSAGRKIKDYLRERRPKRIIFDFEKVKFFSSQLLGLLLDIRAKTKKYDGKIVISAINPQLHRVFKITNLERIFSFFPDKKSALKSEDSN